MTHSIKIDDDVKGKLEEFIAYLRLEKKIKISQQELLSKIIMRALSDKESVINDITNESTSLENDPLWIAIHNPIIMENPPSSEELDKLEEELWQNKPL